MDSIRASERETGRGATPLPGFHGLVGESAPMRALFRQIEYAAAVPLPVLIQGESGTGKELVAHAIHALSPRAEGPFRAVNCAGLLRELLLSQLFGHERGAFTGAVRDHLGAFRAAQKGTVFLDEVGELSLEVQAMLLRAIATGEIEPLGALAPVRVKVRVLAATHRDLGAAVHAERFREDLYFRLAHVGLEIPPLRDRLDDLPLLVEHLRQQLNTTCGLDVEGVTAAAMDRLAAHPWPGNVRELEAVLGHAMTMRRRGWLTPEDLVFRTRPTAPAAAGPAPSIAAAARRDPAPRRQAVALDLVAAHGAVTRRALATACRISGECARQALVTLVAAGRLRRVGTGRQTAYVAPREEA